MGRPTTYRIRFDDSRSALRAHPRGEAAAGAIAAGSILLATAGGRRAPSCCCTG